MANHDNRIQSPNAGHLTINSVRCSICMATYNGEEYIYEQVKSILDQMSTDDEIIISDDGSSDGTINILKSFQDNRIKIFVNDQIKGPTGNFGNALSKANGNLIFLADQDDKWLNHKLETHVKFHDTYDLVISDAIVIDERGNVIFDSFFEERGSKPGLIKNLIKNSYIGCCMSFNRNVLNQSLPFPKNIHMHDWWIGLVAELKGKPYFCEQKLMYYVRHQNNASPTLGVSGYSALKRIKNRLRLLYSLLCR